MFLVEVLDEACSVRVLAITLGAFVLLIDEASELVFADLLFSCSQTTVTARV